MAVNPSVKKCLLTEIEQLPENQLTQVLQVVGTLQANAQNSKLETNTPPDPLEFFIGAVSLGFLAQNADAEL